MTDEQIESAKRRAWVAACFNHICRTDEETGNYPLPSENFSRGFDAGLRFALSQTASGATIPVDGRIAFFDPGRAGGDSVLEYTMLNPEKEER